MCSSLQKGVTIIILLRTVLYVLYYYSLVFQNVEDNSIMGKYKKVVFVEDMFDVITEVHEKELLHAGYRKTYEKVSY